MTRISSLFAKTLPFLLLPLGCSNESSSMGTPPAELTDTLGYKFKVYCSGTLCLLDPEDSNLAPHSCDSGYGVDRFAVVWDKILTIQAVNVPYSGSIQLNAAQAAHPVSCDDDTDCITKVEWSGGMSATYACQYGLCQQTQFCSGGKCQVESLMTNDVLTLCQWDIPWPTACPYLASPAYATRILEVAATCGPATHCSAIPADCRQVGPGAGGPYDGGAYDGGAYDGGT